MGWAGWGGIGEMGEGGLGRMGRFSLLYEILSLLMNAPRRHPECGIKMERFQQGECWEEMVGRDRSNAGLKRGTKRHWI